MMSAANPYALTAASELQRRRAALIAAVSAGDLAQEAGEANLNNWLAIACAAGADGPEFAIPRIYPKGTQGRAFADDFAPRARWRAELERARDAAIAAHLRKPGDAATLNKAINLNQLARHLGCAPITTRKAQDHAQAA